VPEDRREQHLFAFRVGYAGRSMEFRVGRTGAVAGAAGLGLLFVLLTQGIYDIRDNITKLRELRALRERVSEQDLSLYQLHTKFEGLVAEVERLRAMDHRVKSLAKVNESLRGGTGSGVGGAERRPTGWTASWTWSSTACGRPCSWTSRSWTSSGRSSTPGA
jgi:hypothetical protein